MSQRLEMTSRRQHASAAILVLVLLAVGSGAFAWDPAWAAPAYTQGDYLFILTRELPGPGGAFSLMDIHSPWPHDDNYGEAHYDAVAFFHDGLIYVVNRAGADNIQVIDPAQDFATIRQFSVGAGSNPQEICFAGPGRAFVTRYDDHELWEVDPETGEHTGTIDLAPLADPDGLPEMHAMAIHGGYLYVTLERLNRDNYWMPEPPSFLAVIDLADNSLVDLDPAAPGMQGFPLAATNPYSGIVIDPLTGDFLIGETGDYGVLDGGIERFDPDLRESRGMLIGEEELGGDLNVWKTANGKKGFAICMTPLPEGLTKVVAFDLFTRENLGTVVSSDEYAYSDMHIDTPRHLLFVADRSYTNPGIRIFDTETLAPLTTGPVPVGLYPLDLLGVPGPNSDVAEQEILRDGLGLGAFPQPAAGPLVLRLQLPADGETRVSVFDPAGRLVAEPLRGYRLRGAQEIPWDPRDRQGKPLAAGTYVVRVRAGGCEETCKVAVVR